MKLRIAFLCLIVLALSGSVCGAVLYTAAPNQSGGTDINCCLGADDFTLASASTVTQLKFWAFVTTIGTDYTGSVVWSIYSNSAGAPGELL